MKLLPGGSLTGDQIAKEGSLKGLNMCYIERKNKIVSRYGVISDFSQLYVYSFKNIYIS